MTMKLLNKKTKIEKNKKFNVELGNLYDVNKTIVEQSIEDLSEQELQNKKDLIVDFVNQSNNEYFMLLCNENKDYTVFHRNKKMNDGEFLDLCEGYPGDRIETVLIEECLPNRGRTKSIELTQDNGAVEIWISINGESFCYYFFPYDTAIIEC